MIYMSIINYKSQIPLIDFLHRQDVRITIFSRYPVCQYTCHGKAATGKKGLCWVRYLSGYAQRVDATSNKKKHIQPITPALLSPVRSSGKADRPVCRLPPCDDADRNHTNPAYRPLRPWNKGRSSGAIASNQIYPGEILLYILSTDSGNKAPTCSQSPTIRDYFPTNRAIPNLPVPGREGRLSCF